MTLSIIFICSCIYIGYLIDTSARRSINISHARMAANALRAKHQNGDTS